MHYFRMDGYYRLTFKPLNAIFVFSSSQSHKVRQIHYSSVRKYAFHSSWYEIRQAKSIYRWNWFRLKSTFVIFNLILYFFFLLHSQPYWFFLILICIIIHLFLFRIFSAIKPNKWIIHKAIILSVSTRNIRMK